MFSTPACADFSRRSASPRSARSRKRCATRLRPAVSRATKSCRPRWFSPSAASAFRMRSSTRSNWVKIRPTTIDLILRSAPLRASRRMMRPIFMVRDAQRCAPHHEVPAYESKGIIMDIKVRDSNGALLAEGDSVTLIKDLKLKGSSTVLKRGTVIKNIHLTDNEDEIEGRTDKVKGLVLRTEFLKKA